MLIAQKYITDAEVKILLLNYNTKPDHYDEDWEAIDDEENEQINSKYESELRFIQESSFRNNVIKNISEKLTKNVLIVLDRLDHGNKLLEYLQKELPNKTIYYIKGEVETEDREKIRKLMEQENNIVCIAMSKIFSTGINIKNLHYIIFANAGKAKIKTIQTIGRGVRILEGKTKLIIFDLADNLYYGKRHLERRKEIYESEGIQHQVIEIQER
jgi:type I site-specific restriction endonuclease